MKINVLDNGYITLIEHWGSDERIIESARMSTNKGFQGWEKDFKLLEYLYNNNHATPFEMAGAIIEVKAPIMVFREWHRHRTQSYNELSGRYTKIPNQNYLPTSKNVNERINLALQSKNKQQQGNTKIPSGIEVDKWLSDLDQIYTTIEELYQEGLDIGIPREIARLPVPVARYSKMRASANLRNWLQFLTLRLAPNAQYEIRQYAWSLHTILSTIFPKTIQLFEQKFKKEIYK